MPSTGTSSSSPARLRPSEAGRGGAPARALLILPLLAAAAGLGLAGLRGSAPVLPAPQHPVAASASPTPTAAAGDRRAPASVRPSTSTSELRFVVTMRGRPVPDARLCVVRSGTDQFARVKVEPDGTQVLRGMPPGEYGIGVEQDDAVPWATDLHLAPGQSALLRVELKRGGEVRGTVTDRAGRPLPGTRVHLIDEATGTAPEERTAVSDEQGRYALKGIASGDHGVRFRHPECKPLDRRGLVFRGRAEEYRIDAVLDAGMRISGRVIDEAGAPIADADIVAGNDDSGGVAKSASDGTFRVAGLTDAPANLSASKAGYGRVVKRNCSGAPGGVVLCLPRAGTVLGRLKIDRVPPQTQVTLTRFDEDLRQVIPADTRFFCLPTTATFAFADVAPGTYWMEVQVEGYEQVERPQIVVGSGQMTRETAIAMRKRD